MHLYNAWYQASHNPLPNDKILDMTKLKAFAHDILNVAKMTISLIEKKTLLEKEKMLVYFVA